jgi:phosphoribosyl 1,2-cyclic phosphodiesterase
MRVRFWGVRGSVPWASAQAIGHGCNTPCVELVQDSGEMLVLDAGSGLVGLGETLRHDPRAVPILLTHYHWDHLQGLPFFSPLYVPGATPTIWAPVLGSTCNAAWVETIFQSPFFPVPYDRLPAPPAVRLLDLGEHTIGSFGVRALPLNHPGGAFAYRIAGSGGDLVYATDHELGDPYFDEPLAAFVTGARVLILDAHFTPEEEPAHRGWGHTTWAGAARFAAAHDVGRLWLFHHKPGRSDVDLMTIEAEARKLFPATDAAGEGDTFDL